MIRKSGGEGSKEVEMGKEKGREEEEDGKGEAWQGKRGMGWKEKESGSGGKP